MGCFPRILRAHYHPKGGRGERKGRNTHPGYPPPLTRAQEAGLRAQPSPLIVKHGMGVSVAQYGARDVWVPIARAQLYVVERRPKKAIVAEDCVHLFPSPRPKRQRQVQRGFFNGYPFLLGLSHTPLPLPRSSGRGYIKKGTSSALPPQVRRICKSPYSVRKLYTNL
ncbi:unnamed protein product, partial [Iphiclides podalirius]